MKTTGTTARTQLLSLLLVAVVVLSTTAGFAAAATATDLTVSITDDDNTLAPGETTTVEIAVTDVDNGVGAAELGIELSDPGVATITDVSVLNSPGNTDNSVAGGGQSADVKYAFASEADDDGVVIVEVTLQAAAEGSTDVNIVENSITGNLVLFDESGAGYDIGQTGSATLTVEDVNQEPVADAGDDQTVTSGDTVNLDGSESMDPDGSIASYSWTELSSSGVSLSGADTDTATFTAPDVSSETTLEFQLEVTDDDSASNTDTVSVTVQPSEAANFQVSNLQAPGSAEQGEEIDVSADVENTGGQAATKSVEFRIDTDDDGSIADESAELSQDVELAPGESTTVDFDVPTGGLDPGTYTHGVATSDDSETAQITITEPPVSGDKETTVSLEPTTQQVGVGSTATYNVVVDSADGGVGAGELRVAVDDASIATITGADVLGVGGTSEEIDIANDGSFVDIDYFTADTDDSGSVTVATVTLEGASAGTASLSVEPANSNSEVLLFDEGGDGYDVTGTNGATVEVLPVNFLVADGGLDDEPAKVAVGTSVVIDVEITNDGAAQSTQPVELLFDLNGDGTAESITTKQVTIAAGATQTVTFTVDVPADASFGERGYSVETVADTESSTMEITPPDINGDGDLPSDLDGDGLYEDVNGDGSADSGDAQALFAGRNSDAVQNNVGAFDFNDDGSVNVGDAQALFSLLANGDTA